MAKKKTELNTEGQEAVEQTFVPDIPAQMEEQQEEIIPEEELAEAVPEPLPVEAAVSSDEKTFLLRILQIQEEGGFGKHLHDIIYERIKQLP